MLRKSSGLSTDCYHSTFKSYSTLLKAIHKEKALNANLLRLKYHLVLLASQILYFAAALQYLSPNKVISGLSEHYYIIMRRLTKSVIRLVTANEEFLGTLEALKNIILEALFYPDGSNIRRA